LRKQNLSKEEQIRQFNGQGFIKQHSMSSMIGKSPGGTIQLQPTHGYS